MRAVTKQMNNASRSKAPLKQPGVAAASRALSILSVFEGDDLALDLTELAERTGFYKSTILRLTESLEAYGMLEREANGDFRLGVELIRLGALARRASDEMTDIENALHELTAASGESATYYVRRNNMRLALSRVDSPKSIRDHVKVGDLLPLAVGGAGRILQKAGTTPRRSKDLYRSVVSLGERDPEVAAVSGPVYSKGALVGALCVSGPISRFDAPAVDKLSALVEQKCRQLSDIM